MNHHMDKVFNKLAERRSLMILERVKISILLMFVNVVFLRGVYLDHYSFMPCK